MQKGFSLVELLIVVAIILIIAAIAIPSLLQARMAANEASAADSVRQIKTAEMSYSIAYPDTGFSPSLGNLGGAFPCTPSSATACILDNTFATATAFPGKSGYIFAATGIKGGGTLNTAFVVGAQPTSFMSTGTRCFCATLDGVLRYNPTDVAIPLTVADCAAFPKVL